MRLQVDVGRSYARAWSYRQPTSGTNHIGIRASPGSPNGHVYWVGARRNDRTHTGEAAPTRRTAFAAVAPATTHPGRRMSQTLCRVHPRRKSHAAWRQAPRRLFGLPTCRPPRSLARKTGLPFLRPTDQGCARSVVKRVFASGGRTDHRARKFHPAPPLSSLLRASGAPPLEPGFPPHLRRC